MSLHDPLTNRASATADAQTWQRLAENAQAAWMSGAVDDSGELFLELEARSSSWLLAIARTAAPKGTAEDVVAQTYLQFFELLVSGTPVENAKALMRTILKRRIIDLLRRRADVTIEQIDEEGWVGLRELPDVTADTPEEEVLARETARQVSNVILDALPEAERDVLIARHFHGLSVGETAQRLHLTDDQVKKRTRRAVELARRVALERGLIHDLP